MCEKCLKEKDYDEVIANNGVCNDCDKKPKLKLIRNILELVSSYDKEYNEYWGHDTAMDKDFIEGKALKKLNNFLKKNG